MHADSDEDWETGDDAADPSLERPDWSAVKDVMAHDAATMLPAVRDRQAIERAQQERLQGMREEIARRDTLPSRASERPSVSKDAEGRIRPELMTTTQLRREVSGYDFSEATDLTPYQKDTIEDLLRCLRSQQAPDDCSRRWLKQPAPSDEDTASSVVSSPMADDAPSDAEGARPTAEVPTASSMQPRPVDVPPPSAAASVPVAAPPPAVLDDRGLPPSVSTAARALLSEAASHEPIAASPDQGDATLDAKIAAERRALADQREALRERRRATARPVVRGTVDDAKKEEAHDALGARDTAKDPLRARRPLFDDRRRQRRSELDEMFQEVDSCRAHQPGEGTDCHNLWVRTSTGFARCHNPNWHSGSRCSSVALDPRRASTFVAHDTWSAIQTLLQRTRSQDRTG